MSLEEIKKSIDKEAKSESAKIISAADTESERILKEAGERALEITGHAKGEAKKEAERVSKERISGAEIEANSVLVAAKESVISKGAVAVKRDVASKISKKLIEKSVSAAIKELSKVANKNDIIIKCGKKNEAALKKLGFEVVRSADDVLLVSTRDGTISIDASAESLAAKMDGDIRSLLNEKLFGKSRGTTR